MPFRPNPTPLLVLFAALVPLAAAQEAPPLERFVLENGSATLVLSADGRIAALTMSGGQELLAQADAPWMLLRIGSQWQAATSLAVSRESAGFRLTAGFAPAKVTASAVVRPHPGWFEIEAAELAGEQSDAVAEWTFANVPAVPRTHVGGWLNVTWDDALAVALIALDERTRADGAPRFRAGMIRKVGLKGGKAALIVAPRSGVLDVLQQVEREQRLPCPTLGGEWAKTSNEIRKSWMITGLTAAAEPAAYQADRVLDVAQSLGVTHVVISLGWWNTSLGSYGLHPTHFPEGVASLKAVADRAHARGLKLGIHVMTRSITKNDAFVTPRPDPRLLTEGEVTLAADVDAAATELPTQESPSEFGTASGYWAYRGTDVLIDEEIVSYAALRGEAPFALTACKRGAYGTVAAPHAAGAKVRHITERYGWYVAGPELAEEIGRRLARLIDDAGLDMVCFDGADVTADPETRFFDGHQVPLALYRNVRRDVLLASNGSSHFGWHLMARGGEEDAMARGYQGWVDHRTVHAWGQYHIDNLLPPDFSWVGIYGHTPTMTAARPDDVELVAARSLGYDAAVGWGLAACFGGPSSVPVFESNGRKEELARVIRTAETLRLENAFTPEERRPLQDLGTHWRLLPADAAHQLPRLVVARYPRSPILQPSSTEPAAWSIGNDLGPQPLRLRIEALPALAPYGAPENRMVADFAQLAFTPAGEPAARQTFEKTGEVHPQAGAVIRWQCDGPAAGARFPQKLAGHGQTAWAQQKAQLPAPLDLRGHPALGLWVRGDGLGEVLNVQLEVSPQSYLHFYLPIDFTGWRYCELGEPEGDRVMEYYHYEKFALHDLPLDRFASLTLMLLSPPPGRHVDLALGRIEALADRGGRLVEPEIRVGEKTLRLPVTLEPEQYLETGDPWGSRNPAVCRVLDADGNELERLELASPVELPAGPLDLRLSAGGDPAARAKVTVMLEGG